MSNDLNQCQFIGRLARDVDVRYSTDGKAIASFTIAVGSQWKDKQGVKQEATEWVNISAFGKLAEICAEYLKKGSQVFVSGKIKTDKYTDKAGVERYSTKIIADNLQMLGGVPAERKPDAPVATQSKPDEQKTMPTGFENFDDDIPF